MWDKTREDKRTQDIAEHDNTQTRHRQHRQDIDQSETLPQKKNQKRQDRTGVVDYCLIFCVVSIIPPCHPASLFLFILSHNPIFRLPKTLVYYLSHWCNFSKPFSLVTCFFLSFQTFYQAFEVHKKEACEKIEWLEQEVNKLEVQMLQGRKFDTALMTGSGRGRPKADGFVWHVRCLLATGYSFRCLGLPIVSSNPSRYCLAFCLCVRQVAQRGRHASKCWCQPHSTCGLKCTRCSNSKCRIYLGSRRSGKD